MSSTIATQENKVFIEAVGLLATGIPSWEATLPATLLAEVRPSRKTNPLDFRTCKMGSISEAEDVKREPIWFVTPE